MSDNKFEKQVQQKLDELKIPPSAAVWQAIENDLREKRRRPAGRWWFAAALAILAGGYFVYSLTGKKASPTTGREMASQTAPRKVIDKSDAKDIPAGASSASQKPTAPADRGNQDGGLAADQTLARADQNRSGNPDAVTQHRNDAAAPSPERAEAGPASVDKGRLAPAIASASDRRHLSPKSSKPLAGRSAVIADRLKNTSFSDKHITAGNNRKRMSDDLTTQKNPKHPLQPALENREGPSAGDTAVARNDDDELAAVGPVSPVLLYGSGSVSNQFTDVVSGRPVPPGHADLPTPPSIKRPPIRRTWQFGLASGIGKSYVTEGSGLNFEKAMVEDVALTTNANFMPGPTFAPYTPSTIKASRGLSLGFVAKKDLSRRFAVSAGLSYVQYNAKTVVGSRVDSNRMVVNGIYSVQTFYRSASAQDYNNRYHYLSLPVEAYFQLNKSQKLPFYLSAGLAVSRLISSNSLHFDGSTGVYYSNNDLLNKTQFGMSSGVSVVLLNRTSFPLWLGPEVRYNFSTLLHQSISEKKRLVYAGISAKIFWKK